MERPACCRLWTEQITSSFGSPCILHIRARLEGQVDKVYQNARAFMADWNVGDALPATATSRLMINAQASPLFIGVESQDIFGELIKYKERAISVHIMKILPKFMLKTPGMRRREKLIDVLMERVQGGHTPAQRADQPRDLIDDYLSLHASDPQFLPDPICASLSR